MTMRFAVNKDCTSSLASGVLWEFFSFMTAASPTGPGWVSVGESDGTSGGMGVTGLITAPASLLDSDAWFVLESPDGNHQILWERDVGGSTATTEAYFYYNKDADYTGGSSSALPTSDSSQEVYGASSNFFSAGYYQFAADDAAPYGWYLFGYGGTTQLGCALFLPITDISAAAVTHPWVLFVASSGFTANNFNIVNPLPTSDSPKAWSYDKAHWGGVSLTTFVLAGADVTGDEGALGGSGEPLGLPFFISTRATDTPAMLLGYTSFIRRRWGAITAKDTCNSRTWVSAGDAFLPWDGTTDLL